MPLHNLFIVFRRIDVVVEQAPGPPVERSDYEQYDYDYYDDAQPQPPSRLDTILPLVT